ncbi:energy-coupling factor ABC transporter permease [Sulfitobacter sp. NFXS29]|uniref:energy-coupling factor ABC transporter permease n=1 Tax=Sulfitobacter sp. NFXS29 TaxID=2818438 RepID=UPI0032DF8E4F
MHIEPGIVDGAKSLLGYATAVVTAGYGLKYSAEVLRTSGPAATATRSVIATGLVLAFFQLLPHPPVGVSEVHLILGSTLFLLFGAVPAGVGLASGLLLQGGIFAPFDLPQYGMNLTTLLVPLFAMDAVARQVVKPGTRYVDLEYRQVLTLSATFQSGIVAWVMFWSFYGHGFTVETVQSVATFSAAYLTVIFLEPLVDLAVLAVAKTFKTECPIFLEKRLLSAA